MGITIQRAQTSAPECPKCGHVDASDCVGDFEVGVRSWVQQCDGCGAELSITRRVEAWYDTEVLP